MRPTLIPALLLFFIHAKAQDNTFPFGQITKEQILLNTYDKDTTAAAVVLKEFGESYVSTVDDEGLNFDHHYVIKILKTDGLDEANIVIPLRKNGSRSQRILSIEASSYNIENGIIKETKANDKNIFTESVNKYFDKKTLVIPNVRVGSVIEVHYILDDPFFVQNFWPWNFQSHIPKMSSEYWATIPANYIYNITWKGYFKFKRNDAKILHDYFQVGGYKTDCARYFFAVDNIPAFKEEEYMTAKSNFIAGINFELSELRRFDGGIDKVTREWKDADGEIQNHSALGVQLRKGKEIFQELESHLTGITDPLERAKKIYHFINTWYRWDEYYGKFSPDGIKKAFEKKVGNVGDINLSLLAALRYAGYNAEPLLLSTRDNGLPIEIHPVLTDFNYVVAKLNIGEKVYLLDATDPLLPFGMLPKRCLNGKGRVFPEKKPSYWYELMGPEKNKTVTLLNLSMQSSGKITGTISFNRMGYDAFEKRKEIVSHESIEKFVEALAKDWVSVTVLKSNIVGVHNVEDAIREEYEVEIDGFDPASNHLLLNPFFSGRIRNNPFRLTERLYPVDFGIASDKSVILNLTYPNTVELVSLPERNALTLPGGTAKFLFDITASDNRIVMNSVLSVSKPVFNSTEYVSLKELFARVVQTQSTDLIFKRKN